MKKLSYLERSQLCKNPTAKKLFEIIHNKKSNLALSADVTTCAQLLKLADTIGPEICVLKTHIDILTDFSSSFITQLQSLASKHNFLIFEDRKFADIGNTVKLQYQEGIYKIVEWADIVNAHSLPGPGIIAGLAAAGLEKNRGLLLLAEMSSAENLFSHAYTDATLEMAKQNPEFVIGFIAQKKLIDHPQWVYMTPGIQFESKGDGLGQQYISPIEAIQKNHTDVIIVGRGILQASDPVKEAIKYREVAWNAWSLG